MKAEIIVSNPQHLADTIANIANGGSSNLHVLADFDRTLTTAFVDGKSVPSLISVLRDGDYLSKDYSQKAHGLFEKYHAIEIDPKVPKEEKIKAMQEWWDLHFDLLIKSGLNKRHLKDVIDSGKVKLRQGCLELIDLLKENNIPLVIMSSSGLGGDVIKMYLDKKGRMYPNIHIISNSFDWDENGNAVSIRKPIIHGMNKCETMVKDFPVFEEIKSRKNVILLGDSLEDIGMVSGFGYDNLIKIGFLNENIAENTAYYADNYDVIILNDGDMEYVNSLLGKIIQAT